MQNNKVQKTDAEHKCTLFHCDHRRGGYCCFYCRKKKSCHNPCLNNPAKCGAVFVSGENKPKGR